MTIRNQTEHAQGANAGFWSAENSDGATVTNKSGLKDADGKAVKMSFNSGCIPPGIVVHGILYFEGSSHTSIAYASHLSGSEEDQRITFRL